MTEKAAEVAGETSGTFLEYGLMGALLLVAIVAIAALVWFILNEYRKSRVDFADNLDKVLADNEKQRDEQKEHRALFEGQMDACRSEMRNQTEKHHQGVQQLADKLVAALDRR